MSASAATRPLYPIPGWQAWLLDVVLQGVVDWLRFERAWLRAEWNTPLAAPAPIALVVPEPVSQPVPAGLRRHGRWLVPRPRGRGAWLAPWVLTTLEVSWNMLPNPVVALIDGALAALLRAVSWLLSWVPRPAEILSDRRCRWTLLGAACLVVAALSLRLGHGEMLGLVAAVGCALCGWLVWVCCREIALADVGGIGASGSAAARGFQERPGRAQGMGGMNAEPCPSWVEFCRCMIDTHQLYHDVELHECRCGGQWTGSDETGDMRLVRFPQRYEDGSPTPWAGLAYDEATVHVMRSLMVEGPSDG